MGHEVREEVRAELDALATRALDHPDELEPREAVRRLSCDLRVWHYPSFEPHRSWALFSGRHSDEGAPLLVREVTWDQVADYGRLWDPMEGLRRGFHTRPTLKVRDALLAEPEYEAIWEGAAALSLPWRRPPEVIGLDGDTFGIECHYGFTSLRLQWWCDGPEEWRPVTEWATALRQLLRRTVERELS